MWELIDAAPHFAVGFVIGGAVLGCMGVGLGAMWRERKSIPTPGEPPRPMPPSAPSLICVYSAAGMLSEADTESLARAAHWLKHTPGRDAGDCLAEIFEDPDHNDDIDAERVEIVRARPAASPDLSSLDIG